MNKTSIFRFWSFPDRNECDRFQRNKDLGYSSFFNKCEMIKTIIFWIFILICSRNSILNSLNMVLICYSNIVSNIRNIFGIGLQETENICFPGIIRKLPLLLSFYRIFSRNELKTARITVQNILSIVGIMIVAFSIKIYNYEEKLNKTKQNISCLSNFTIIMIENNKSPFMSLWNNNGHFWGVGLGCKNESIDQGWSYENENLSISNCYFSRSILFSGNGGVIYINGASYSMNVNYSMFYNCVCSGNGGAIYYSSYESNLRMICSNSCSAAYYHFAYLLSSHWNQVEYLSQCNCSYTTSGYYPIKIEAGNQRVDYINSSMNNAIEISGIGIATPSSFTSSYCTFSNNKVSGRRCIWLYCTSGTISLSYSNIVHNNSPFDGVILVWGAGSKILMNCIFKNNHNYLFCVYSGSLEVSHSFIDHSSSFSTSTAVSTETNNSFTNRITYEIIFFNSIHCNTDSPISTPMITFISPNPTMEMTKINTLIPTPYRSYEELSPHQSLFPIHTPYNTHYPERTNQRSWLEERTPSFSNEQSNNSVDESKTNTIFMYSTFCLIIIIGIILTYNCITHKNQNDCSSSPVEIQTERREV